eukprot:TRINITY_DN70776_c0_g1_i1.p1 TRINITY_DN70776_c0_g1~~TRINITY_DN70776_c0_g1_i1.p1  ORF type:complete len:1037 (+),score=155.44 TRINITY_DN70776_c0_g1_i1:700-3810(+)
MANFLCDMKCVRMRTITVDSLDKRLAQPYHPQCFHPSLPLLPSTGAAKRFSSSICSFRRILIVSPRKMTPTVNTHYTTVPIQPHCIAQKAAELPRDQQPKSVVFRFPWRPFLEATVQIVILTLGAVVSVQARLKVFVYLFCALAVPQLFLIATRFQALINGAVRYGERFQNSSPSGRLPESPSSEISQQPISLGNLIRKTITEELGAFRSELADFEKLSIEREEFRNISISQALSSVSESVLALKEDMERRDQLRPSVPYATLQQLEALKTRLSFFERENAGIKHQLKTAQLNYEEALAMAAKSRKEAENASYRELSVREELAVAQSRTIHLDELTDRLDRAESKNLELQEELLSRAREREGLRLSADNANRRVTRVENIANALREKLQKLSGSSSYDAKDAPVDEDSEESEKKFWQRRLRNRGNLGRDSVVYQELLRGSKASLSKEWPSDPLGRDSSTKEEKRPALEGLPADGGFAGKNFKMLESAPNLAGDKKFLSMSGASSESAFSFSRGEFEGEELGTNSRKPSEKAGIDVYELFPKAEDLSGKSSSATQGVIKAPSQVKTSQSDVSGEQDGVAPASKRPLYNEATSEGEQPPSLKPEPLRARNSSGGYMRWLEKASRKNSSQVSSRTPSDSLSESRSPTIQELSPSRSLSTAQPQPDARIQTSEQYDADDKETSMKDNGGVQKPTPSSTTPETNQATRKSEDESINEASDSKDGVKETSTNGAQPASATSGSSSDSRDNTELPSSMNLSVAKVSLLEKGKASNQIGEKVAGGKTKSVNVKNSSSGLVQDNVLPSQDNIKTLEDPAKLRGDPGGPSSIAQIISSKIAEAQAFIEKGRRDGISVSQAATFFEKARNILEECLRLNSLRPQVEATLGECLVAWAKLDLKDQKARWLTWKALEYLSRSVRAQPSDEKALFNCALCNALFGALSSRDVAVRHQYTAAQQFDRLLKLNPSAQVAAYNGGLAYLYLARSNIAYDGKNSSVIQKHFELAIERFAKGVMLNPHDPRNAAYLDTARNEMKNFMDRAKHAEA